MRYQVESIVGLRNRPDYDGVMMRMAYSNLAISLVPKYTPSCLPQGRDQSWLAQPAHQMDHQGTSDDTRTPS